MPTTGKDLKGRQSSMSNKKPLPGYIWLLAGLAIGLFFAFLVYLEKQPKEKLSFTEAVVQELEKVKQNKKEPEVKKTEQKSNTKEPKFDFYTILPELEVFIPESEITSQEEKKSAKKEISTTLNTEKKYLLQAGSFRSHEDADQLKASLALLGVTSSIQSVNIKSETWHRVRIGPFNNAKQLQNTLSTLKNNNIHAMTMELK